MVVEVSVLKADGRLLEGVPSPFLSIRVGDTRRQCPLQENEVFRFPTQSSQSCKVDLFARLGTIVVPMDKDGPVDVSIPNSLNPAGKEVFDLTLGIAGVDVPEGDQISGVLGRLTRHKAALNARLYLDEHGVQQTLQPLRLPGRLCGAVCVTREAAAGTWQGRPPRCSGKEIR